MVNETETAVKVDVGQRVYALQHLDSAEFICLLQDGIDYLACFSNGDDALQFRSELGLHEHVSLYVSSLEACPFRHFWLDGNDMVLDEKHLTR